MSKDHPQDSRDSRLLGLPPEIRNTIYRLVLVDGTIKITPQTLAKASQPSLLQVNPQIRSEASTIYYQENRIVWMLKDYNAAAFLKWKASSNYRRQARTNFVLEGKPVWKNVLQWLEAFFRYQTTGVGRRKDGNGHAAGYVVAQMFEVASDRNLPWAQVKQIVDRMRKAAGAYEPDWLEDT